MKHIIWTSDIDIEDWRDDILEWYPEANEDEIYDLAYRENDSNLDDERANLNRQLENNVVCVGDLGLWDGRKSGYKFLGTNLNDIFSGTCGDIVEWYVEDGEIKCRDCHHDGVNYYTYRMLKPYIGMYEFEEYAFEHCTKDAVKEYTEPLGHYIQKVYGWEE